MKRLMRQLVQLEAEADGAHKGAMTTQGPHGARVRRRGGSCVPFEVSLVQFRAGAYRRTNPLPQIPFAFLSVRDLRWLRWGVLGPPFHSASSLRPSRPEAAVLVGVRVVFVP